MKEPARLPSGEWLQDSHYPQPLWTATAAELAQRISIGNLHGLYALSLLDHYNVEPYAGELFTLSRWKGQRRYRVAMAESERPLEEGFLRRVRFWFDNEPPEQPADPHTVFADFVRAETARIGDIEPWLRRRYGEHTPPGDLFTWIDYPVFDCGTMVLGFAIFIHGRELHVWSRAAHAHK